MMLPINQPKTAIMFLKKAEQLMLDRGKEYNGKVKKERSFTAVATAFTATTGKPITPAEVCLMLQILKNVRQWSQDRFHTDSVEAGVTYTSLMAEELYKQYEEQE
jgi:hypothetical protein